MSEAHIFEETFEPLGKRIVGSLMKSDYDSLEELHELSDKELVKISGITKNSLNEVRGLLAARGFEKAMEFDSADAQAKLNAAVAAPVKRQKAPKEKKSIRKGGQIVMLCNLYDPGFRRPNTGQKLSVVIGDVVIGNEDKEWDLPRDYVDVMISRGEAGYA